MNALAIALSVPVFFLSMGIEYALSRWLARPTYRLTDAIGSLSCGVVQQATSIFLRASLLGAYALFLEGGSRGPGARFFTPDSVLAWLVLMVLVDHQYYWFHRASHRVNVFWATHVVHHQSEDYNLSTALRQSALQALVSVLFYLPIALLGVPATMFVTAITANTLYQFWIHTRLVGKLGPLEWVLNTPSHHRVHHAIDPQYVDKNYGGITIVWDRLYGTFAEEREEPSYGTVKVLNSFNALWANLDSWAHLGRLLRASTTWRERLWAPFAPPEWQPAALGGKVTIPSVDRARRVLYDVPTSASLRRYVMIQFVIAGACLVAELLLVADHSALELAALATWISVSTAAFSGLLERKRWAPWVEIGRLIVLPAVVWQRAADLAELSGADPRVLVGLAIAVTALSLVHSHLAYRAPLPSEAS